MNEYKVIDRMAKYRQPDQIPVKKQSISLERIVEKAAVIAFSLGFLYLAYGTIFGNDEAKEQIAQALKTTLYFGPNGTAVDAQLFKGEIDSSVRKWLDYPNKNTYKKDKIETIRK
jgi:hypothetical protein